MHARPCATFFRHSAARSLPAVLLRKVSISKEFKKLLQRKRHFKVELCVRLSVLRLFDYSVLVKLYKIGEVHFRLFDMNGFYVKAENERFTAASSRCHQNLKYENFTSSFGRLRQQITPKSVAHVQHDYFS